ncbi:beta-glucosidase BglX [Fictibacillus barbaricus]|uniref:beta-glucosidase n=1 Tax=Fictibacillus barbaricus TaxID=182136 RepID=A0ABU1TW68_9BACL|nr:beta-glucosidase BglX [Fictibacillus barbaricus]MDR7071447.1 beta-glucosidase [Fictibacillus barbaricus]
MNNNRIASLVEKMTLHEKIAQLIQLATPFYKGATNGGQITGPMAELGVNDEDIVNSGSVLGASGAKEVKSIQEMHLKENRHGIPLLMMADIVHGYKTIFPVPLAIGCSWDLEAAEKSAEVAAREASVSGVHVTFAPMVDLVRDPRWGRVMESTGEDPYLNSEFARAFVRGFQGDNLTEDKDRVAACVKHFAAYGAAEAGRDYNTVDMSERQLRESYLPAYKAALDEGCEMVMTSFNSIEGIPATGNKWLMRDILREEMGFNGVLISDWGAVKEQIPHGVVRNEKEAAEKSIQAGVDIEMMTACYIKNLETLVKEGKVEEQIIDEGVYRILELKEKLGLFENPHRGADEEREKEVILSESHRKAAYDLAVKSTVLLKNEGALPLNNQKKIALIGPFAKSGDILGAWSWMGSHEEAVSLYEGMHKKVSAENLLTAKGCDIETGSEEMMNEAIAIGKEADIIVLAIGEESGMSGEARCRADIRLPEIQLELLSKMKQLGKQVVVVLFNGRPLDLTGMEGQADAILEAWFPGTEGGNALADLLFGDVNPSGKLSMSFPYTLGQVPIYYNNYNTGRPKNAAVDEYVSKYLDIPNEPLYPFGYGLSYTNYKYSDLSVSSSVMTLDQPLIVTVNVTNTGELAGDEVVQLYVRDMVGEVIRPLKELKAFEKVTLTPGETKTIEFTLSEEQLRYHHRDLSYTSDAGEFTIFVGPNSRDVSSATFELTK